MIERWIYPAVGFTAFNYIACEALRPATGLLGQISFGNALLSAALFCDFGLCVIFAYIVRLAVRRHPAPIAALKKEVTTERLIQFVILALLVNINLAVLGEVKSQLNQLVGFTADLKLAYFDQLLFFGTDGWRALRWLNHPYLDDAYHYVWILWVSAALIYVGLSTTSVRKNALLTAYFALWTLGPIIHLLMPAAGPLFFDKLNLGHRFSALPVEPHTAMVQAYLWTGYATRTINFAGGISAMPSLHIATMTWAAIAFYRTRVFPLAIGLALYIFGASIVTGWHYATDGIVGAVLALLTYEVCRRVFSQGGHLLPKGKVVDASLSQSTIR